MIGDLEGLSLASWAGQSIAGAVSSFLLNTWCLRCWDATRYGT
jgi:hypothetical protein